MKVRSQIHMLTVVAGRLEGDHANPKLVADLRKAAEDLAAKRAQGRTHDDNEQRRIERQRNLFTMLTPGRTTDNLEQAMLQRAYDLLWDGDCMGCDALLEFVPENASTEMLNAWMDDQDGKHPKSRWYGDERA